MQTRRRSRCSLLRISRCIFFFLCSARKSQPAGLVDVRELRRRAFGLRGLRLRARPVFGKISAKCCSFSAVSAPIFARKYAFCSIFQNLPDFQAEILKFDKFLQILRNLQFFFRFQRFQLDSLVAFEKCRKTRIYLQRSVPTQPKTSNILPTFCRSAVVSPTGALAACAGADRVHPAGAKLVGLQNAQLATTASSERVERKPKHQHLRKCTTFGAIMECFGKSENYSIF